MATKLKVKNELFREWGEFFMCPAYQQFVQLGFCASRFQKSSDPACGFDACKRCPIRKFNFHQMRNPRVGPEMDRVPRLS